MPESCGAMGCQQSSISILMFFLVRAWVPRLIRAQNPRAGGIAMSRWPALEGYAPTSPLFPPCYVGLGGAPWFRLCGTTAAVLAHLSQLAGSASHEAAPELHRGQKVCTTGRYFRSDSKAFPES
jgi:hypothetical protein